MFKNNLCITRHLKLIKLLKSETHIFKIKYSCWKEDMLSNLSFM